MRVELGIHYCTPSGTMFAESSEQSTDIGIHRKLAVKTSFQLRAMK